MNTQSVGLRIFIASAVSVAFGYLLALRFGSWWWTLSALPIGIFLYDPLHSQTTSTDMLKKLNAHLKNPLRDQYPQVVEFGEGVLIALGFVLQLIRGLLIYGVGLIILWWLLISIGGNNFTRTKDFFTFLCFILASGMMSIIGSEILRGGPGGQDGKRPLWLVSRLTSKWFPHSKKKEGVYSPGIPFKQLATWRETDGTYFTWTRMFSLLKDSGKRGWEVLEVGGIFLCYALTFPITFALIATDILLNILFTVVTHASIGAGVGGFLGALTEYALYPHLTTAGGDIARFILFMTLGGVFGVGIYKLRELASRDDTQPATAGG